MSITFPTRSQPTANSTLGQPTRASHCVCKPPLLLTSIDHNGDRVHECLKCGRPQKQDVAVGWQARAEEIASRNRARAAKASARKARREAGR